MSEYVEYRKAFYKEAIAHGISVKEQIKEAFPLGYAVPEQKMISWLSKLSKLPSFSSQRRYINRFKLGADPEFVFVSGRRSMREEDETRMDANSIGMRQGQAFGADNNGRLTEIRPHPSRSALKVCASIMSTLRWMALCFPDVLELQWRSGAFIHGDGIGGHVHFGRKRPNRRTEVAALDVLSEMLLSLGVYPAAENNLRRNGDRLHQIYGRPGDFRIQQHGYEYRTFPSWLDTPSLAFITITLAKLVVCNPELMLTFPVAGSGSLQLQRIKNLCAYYKDVDDDALLACYILRRGLPRHGGGDFKAAWGSDVRRPVGGVVIPTMIPTSIPSAEVDEGEMFAHLMEGTPLRPRVPSPTWAPLNPPRGYHMVLTRTTTLGMKGLGEMIWDICGHDSMRIAVSGARAGSHPLTISRALTVLLGKDWQKGLHVPIRVGDELGGGVSLHIAQDWRESGNARKMKDALLSGVFPLWRVHNAGLSAMKDWVANRGEIGKESKKWKSKVILEDGNYLDSFKNLLQI